MHKNINAKIKKIEDELTSLQAKVEKNNTIIRESEENVSRLKMETHDAELDQVLHCSLGTANLLEITRSSLAASEQTLEDSLLRSEAFSREKLKLESDLLSAQDELKASQAKHLASELPELLSAYNQGMQQAHDAAVKIKSIALECKNMGHTGPLKEIDPGINSMIQHLPVTFVLAKWISDKHLTQSADHFDLKVLHYDERDRKQIIDGLLNK